MKKKYFVIPAVTLFAAACLQFGAPHRAMAEGTNMTVQEAAALIKQGIKPDDMMQFVKCLRKMTEEARRLGAPIRQGSEEDIIARGQCAHALGYGN